MLGRDANFGAGTNVANLRHDDEAAHVPESYYECPNCGVIGSLGVGYVPTQAER